MSKKSFNIMDAATNEENQPKRVRIEDNEDSKEPTKMADINTDCLEKIFMELELDDLLNISDTCQQFKATANFVFNVRFAKKMIIINDIRKSHT